MTPPLRVAVIVEGDGEVGAVPVLLRRFAEMVGWPGMLEVKKPFRVPASKLRQPGELERLVELAGRKLGGSGGILVLLDADDECPARLGPELLGRVRQSRSDLPTGLVLANHEFEAWFLGAAESLAGKRGLPSDLKSHPDPEAIRGCKEWLCGRMPRGRAYNEVEDQAALTAVFDLEAARINCPSFDKCHRELTSLLRAIAAITPGFPS
jgi:hypothetical protein